MPHTTLPPTTQTSPSRAAALPHTAAHAGMLALSIGALGVVFGDIGTSPLYTLRECLLNAGGNRVNPADVFGILSLMIWALILVVTVKYLFFILRADHNGEGGIFALLATVPDRFCADALRSRRVTGIALLGVIGAALLYGDGVITPAIPVLSAVEGLTIANTAFRPWVVPLAFRDSVKLAAAYGIAVTGAMAITSVLFFIVIRYKWGWPMWKAASALAFFLLFDIPFLAANMFKFFQGGYVPVLIRASLIAAMLIWNRGRTFLAEQYAARFPPFGQTRQKLRGRLATRVPGTAVFIGSSFDYVPPILIHFVERCRSLHQTVMLLTVRIEGSATIPADQRYDLTDLGAQRTRLRPATGKTNTSALSAGRLIPRPSCACSSKDGFLRVVLHFGYIEQPNGEALVEMIARESIPIDPSDFTYYVGREKLTSAKAGRMGKVAEGIFSYLQRNAVDVESSFRLPAHQVVEIGTQAELV